MGSETSRQQVAPASSNSRNRKVLSAAFGKSIWIASTCAPVMAKMWVARSTNAPVNGWLRKLLISAPSSAQTSIACENVRRPRLTTGSLWSQHCPGESRLRLWPRIFGRRKTPHHSRILSAFRPDHARSNVESAAHPRKLPPLHRLGEISHPCAESKRDCCLLSL